jgi:hypothetical protein
VSLDDGNLTSYQKLLFEKLDLIIKGLNSLQSEKTRNAVICEGNLVNFNKIPRFGAWKCRAFRQHGIFSLFNYFLTSNFSFFLFYLIGWSIRQTLKNLKHRKRNFQKVVEFDFVRNVGYRNYLES